MKNKIVNIEKNLPHKVSELICVLCKKRFISARPAKALLKDLECVCGEKGFLIETGEDFDGRINENLYTQ